jgi:hypothetical protein
MNKDGSMHKACTFTKKIGREICRRIAAGETLTKICKDKRMPIINSIYDWIRMSVKNPEEFDYFHLNYRRARAAQADTQFDVISDLCDDVEAGLLDPNAARVIIGAKQWQMSKIRPDQYGDKLQVDQDTSITIEVVNFTDMKKITHQSDDDAVDLIGYPEE